MPCCRRGYRAEQAAAEEGATFAVWYDEIDRLRRGYGSYALWPVIDGMVHVLAQKMWGQPTAPRSYEEHCALAERVGNIPCCDPLHRAAEPFELAPKRFPLRKEGRMSTFVLPLQQLGALSKVRCSVSNLKRSSMRSTLGVCCERVPRCPLFCCVGFFVRFNRQYGFTGRLFILICLQRKC